MPAAMALPAGDPLAGGRSSALISRWAPMRALFSDRTGRRGRARAPFWSLADGGEPPKRRFIALVPGADAPLMEVDLPSGLRGPARMSVARRQLTDRLGEAIAGMELRPAPLAGAGASWRAMVMIRRDDLARWRKLLARHGRAVRAILPDYLALPAAEGVWTIRTGDGPEPLVQVRMGPGDGFSGEPALAALALTRALEAPDRRPRAVLRMGPPLPAFDAPLEAALTAHPEIKRATSPEALPHEIARPRVLAHGELALDLAQPLRDARRELEARLRGAVLPIALLVAAAAIWSAASLREINQLRTETRAVQARNIALVREAFVPSGPLPDMRLQVARLIEERRAALKADPGADPERPLTRLRQASAVLAETPAARLDSIILQPDGRIVMEVRLSDFTDLEKLLAALRDGGLEVSRDRAASDESGAVLGTVTVLPGPGQADDGARP